MKKKNIILITYDYPCKCTSKEYIFIKAASSTSSEQYYIKTNAEDFTPKLFYLREENHILMRLRFFDKCWKWSPTILLPTLG
mgnify:CR=1 FL=1